MTFYFIKIINFKFKIMKKNRYVILFLLPILVLQVKDISFTPFAEYTWWDDQSGLKDGTLLGGKLGFGLANIWSCVRYLSTQT
jgi:hypothetical protein